MSSPLSRRRTAYLLSIVLLWAYLPDGAAPKKGKNRQAETVADLQVVDCLLPGKVRRLGGKSQFLTPRRPIRTTTFDCQIRGGEYTAYDRASYATSLKIWLPDAQAGDAEAQTYVGEIFEKGLAAVPDYESAALWYRKAAEQGHSRAQINLGHLYEKGLGVEVDPQAALEWYRRAAGIDEAVVLDWTEQEATLRQEAEGLRAELEATQKQLDEALAELEEAQAEARELRQRMDAAESARADEKEELESRLHHSETRLADIRRTIRGYRDRLSRLKAREASDAAVAGPTITIVEPNVLSTRGPMIVAAPGGVTEVEVTGRVTAPAGLRDLRLDGVRQEVDDSGFFRLEAAISAGRTTLLLEAVDLRGQRARAELVIDPGARTPAVAGGSPPPPRRARRPSPDHHALILSVADYQNLPDLKTVRTDAAEVERVLSEKYGYQTTVLTDPTHFEILNAINALARALEEKDHLLIYYAGHGKIRDGKGYWIGSDGTEDDPSRWIPNGAISDQLDVMKAKHVLVVSDSCYSGTLTLSGVAHLGPDAEGLEQIGGRRSRTVLTSGGLQPVLDEGGGRFSIFAQAFLRVLELNEHQLAGTDLHREVAARVRFAARTLGFRQTPDYAPIRYSGHSAGDFVLSPRTAG